MIPRNLEDWTEDLVVEMLQTGIFESEHFENFNNSWKAKETYEVVSNDEFIETFELAPPGKPFEIYSRNHLKRVPHRANN